MLIKAHINMVPTEELEGFRLPEEGLEPAARKPFEGQRSDGVSECSVACSPSNTARPMIFWIVLKQCTAL